MFLEDCVYKKEVFSFLSVGTTQYFFISRYSERYSMQFGFFLAVWEQTWRPLLSNFQQKFALVRVFNILPLNFWPKKCLVRLKSASKSLLSWQGKCDVFLFQLYLAMDPSNLTSKNDVPQLAELQMHVQK